MNENQIFHNGRIIEDCKLLIDKNLYKILFYLFKYIFLNDKKTISSKNAKKKLNSIIKVINTKIIKNEKKFIELEYSKNNFINIFRFVKSQNIIYAADIIENIMIIIFSLAFKTNKENTFAKYIYNNLKNIKKTDNIDLAEWFDSTKFKPDELKNFKILLQEGPFFDNDNKMKITEIQKNNIFYFFLIKLNIEKRNFYKEKLHEKINNKKEQIKKTIFSTNKLLHMEEQSSYLSININEYREDLNRTENISINITRSFFISVYIYYQNKNSPLMKYIKKNEESEEMAIIPFIYDFSGAVIREKFAEIVMAPARIEPRIHCLDMSKNILHEKGLIELYKIMIFNKNIKKVDFHRLAIKSRYLRFINKKYDLFYNYEIEELNLEGNYINEDSIEYISNILYYFKGLKTLNLSLNNLKSGISSFLIGLKNLYRQNKTKLENLYLIDCFLDDTSFYELGQLISCKYCKLKNLYLNKNNIPLNSNFLKKLKKNKSLTEIYFNNCNLTEEDIDDIMKIISNTNIECLSLYKNDFSNFNNCLKILFRTKLIMNKNEKNKRMNRGTDSLLYNLDLSDNDYFLKNNNHIFLLAQIFEQTTLYCIDLAHILFGLDPKKENVKTNKSKYKKEVISLRNKLEEQKQNYIDIIQMINTNEIKAEKLKKYDNKRYNEKMKEMINEIISDKNSIFPLFLREKAKLLKIKFFENDNEENLMKYIEFKLIMKKLNELKEKRKERKIFII